MQCLTCQPLKEEVVGRRDCATRFTIPPGIHREDTHAETDAGAKRQEDAKPLPFWPLTLPLHLYCGQLIIHGMYCGSRPAITYRTETAPSATCPRIERMSSALRRGRPTDPG